MLQFFVSSFAHFPPYCVCDVEIGIKFCHYARILKFSPNPFRFSYKFQRSFSTYLKASRHFLSLYRVELIKDRLAVSYNVSVDKVLKFAFFSISIENFLKWE